MAFNWQKALGGGLSGGLGGAASGALIGSVVPGLGTAIGAGAGGLAGLLGGGLAGAFEDGGSDVPGGGGGGGGFEKIPSRFSPEQQEALKALLEQGLSTTKNPTAGFDPIDAYHRNQFAEQTIPSIAERFTAMGGGQRSSAFQGALGSAAAGLESKLAALRANYGLQNQQSGLSMLNMGLTPQNEYAYFGQRPGFGQQLLETGSGALGTYFGSGGTLGGLGIGQNKPSVNLTPEQKTYLVNVLKNMKVI